MIDDHGSCGALAGVQEAEESGGFGEADLSGSGVVAVVFQDSAGLLHQVGDADVGDLQKVGQDLHGTDLPLVEEREQEAGGGVEQGLGAEVAGGAPSSAAALPAVPFLGAGGLCRRERGGQLA
ncbi:hypothetical protein OHB01_13655 [Microbispora hainanensis]|nr:hypothetical protein [Microbispora hainanensis]